MHTIIDKKKINIKQCDSFVNRLLGNMFKKEIDIALLFDHCNSIHTFFMKVPIDVVLCDANNNILSIYKSLKPNKVIFPQKNVTKIYEFPNNTFNNIPKKISIYQ